MRSHRYPPADGASFAVKYLEGCYTYYTAPVESDESVALRMEQQDEALSPMEVCSVQLLVVVVVVVVTSGGGGCN